MAELPRKACASPRSCGIPGPVPTQRDDASTEDISGWIADRLASARADAERIARELVRDGRVTADEVAALAAAVDEAVERGRALIGDALREPRRILAGLRQAAANAPARAENASGAPQPEDPTARITRLEARVAALDALVTAGAKPARGGDGDGI